MNSSNLRKLRKKLKMTQEEFGCIVGASKAAVSRWETGNRRLDPEIAKWFMSYAKSQGINVSLDFLYKK